MGSNLIARGSDPGEPTMVTLYPEEFQAAVVFARMRNESNEKHGCKNRLYTGLDGSNNQIGMEGEFAFAKWANVYPDLTIGPQTHTYDCFAYGLRIDVKATDNPTAQRLVVEAVKRESDQDAFVQVVKLEEHRYWIAAWMWSHEIFSRELDDLGHGKNCYAPFFHECHAIEELEFAAADRRPTEQTREECLQMVEEIRTGLG